MFFKCSLMGGYQDKKSGQKRKGLTFLMDFKRKMQGTTAKKHRTSRNCLRFANPAEAIGSRHSEAWRLRCVEAQKLGGSDMLMLAASWIFLMASGELPTFMFLTEQ